jgi:hypothetical protein
MSRIVEGRIVFAGPSSSTGADSSTRTTHFLKMLDNMACSVTYCRSEVLESAHLISRLTEERLPEEAAVSPSDVKAKRAKEMVSLFPERRMDGGSTNVPLGQSDLVCGLRITYNRHFEANTEISLQRSCNLMTCMAHPLASSTVGRSSRKVISEGHLTSRPLLQRIRSSILASTRSYLEHLHHHSKPRKPSLESLQMRTRLGLRQ